MQSVFLHPTAIALAKLLPAPESSDTSAQPLLLHSFQPAYSVDDDTASNVETCTSAVLAYASPMLFLLHHLWRLLSGLVSFIPLLYVGNIVGWPGILPLLLLVLFFSELFTTTTSAALMICLKWLLVGRLRPSSTSAGPQRLAFLRWRVGRLIQKELQPTSELIRGTVLQNYLLRALGTRVSASAVIETTGARQMPHSTLPRVVSLVNLL